MRWGFSMRDYLIVIEGDRNQRPIFDGKGISRKKARQVEFLNIVRYSAYGGLHAIYVMRFSSGMVIEGNTFSHVFACGVIKFRHFSNFGKVVRNRFDDNTSLLENSYCDRDLRACQQLDFIDCPSWGIEFADNTYRYFRAPGTSRPTLDISRHPANDNYCRNDRFWTGSKLEPGAPWNQVKGVERVISRGNKVVGK